MSQLDLYQTFSLFSYNRAVLAAVLECGEDVVLLPDVQPALLPGVLQLQRLEVVSETPLARPDHRHQAEVLQLVGRVDRPLLTFQHHSHVQLLHHQVHHLAGGGPGGDVQLERRAARQARLVGGEDLQNPRLQLFGSRLRQICGVGNLEESVRHRLAFLQVLQRSEIGGVDICARFDVRQALGKTAF